MRFPGTQADWLLFITHIHGNNCTVFFVVVVPILIELVVYRIFLVCENPEYVNLDIRVRTVLTPVV